LRGARCMDAGERARFVVGRICWSDYEPVTCCVEINVTATTTTNPAARVLRPSPNARVLSMQLPDNDDDVGTSVPLARTVTDTEFASVSSTGAVSS